MNAPTHLSEDQSTTASTIVPGCANRDCAVRWPPSRKGDVVTNGTCRCVHDLVRDGSWLVLLRALTVRTIEIENLSVQVDGLLREQQDNCNE